MTIDSVRTWLIETIGIPDHDIMSVTRARRTFRRRFRVKCAGDVIPRWGTFAMRIENEGVQIIEAEQFNYYGRKPTVQPGADRAVTRMTRFHVVLEFPKVDLLKGKGE